MSTILYIEGHKRTKNKDNGQIQGNKIRNNKNTDIRHILYNEGCDIVSKKKIFLFRHS